MMFISSTRLPQPTWWESSFFFFSSRRRHTRCSRDWSSDVCSSDLATCGPFAEDATYVTATGQTVNGTRGPLGSAFSNDDYEGSVGNSNYNSFQADFRHS